MDKRNSDALNKMLKLWFPIAVATTVIFLTFFLAIQQNYRISANDPQIQLAEDISTDLSNGQNPQYYIPPKKIDMETSLANFLIIYDSKGKVVASSVQLNGKDPTLPQGVLDDAKNKGERRITWQPAANVRTALIVNYYKGIGSGYVAVGRSLREIEKREGNLQYIIFLGYIFTLAATFASIYIIKKNS